MEAGSGICSTRRYGRLRAVLHARGKHPWPPCTTSFWMFFLIAGVATISSCDSVEPSDTSRMVIEGFLQTGNPLPEITITRARPLEQSTTDSTSFIRDATFRLFVDDIVYPYGPSAEGGYTPLNSTIDRLPQGARIRAEISWQSQTATTEDLMPPPITIEDVHVEVPAKPVTAILVDTLRFDTPQVGARQGFIYPIDVTITWSVDPALADPGSNVADSTFWIEARLIPQSDFSSTVLDVFLLPEEVLQENSTALKPAGLLPHQRAWTGVYAVPVDDSLSLPPTHNLTVQLVRGTRAYADFANSRNIPERREPISNIDGAIGILAGIALDSKAFEVKHGLATARP